MTKIKRSLIKSNDIFSSANSFANLLSEPRVTIDYQKNTASIYGYDNNNSYCSITINNCPNGSVKTQTSFNHHGKKSNFESDIIILYNDGHTQNEISNMLGISQSYVSKLLKNK